MLMVTPAACAMLLLIILRLYAAEDVRQAGEYLLMYSAMGAGWVGILALYFFPYFGFHYLDDAVERANPAATAAICGALIGFTFAFAGGNIGDGPGWWVVVFSSGLATVTLAASWALLARLAAMHEEITVDRDMATGLRLGGFLVAGGMICGRAAAGNWVSATATFHDFWRVGWIMVPLLVLTWVFDYGGSPNAERPKPPVLLFGVLPALLSIGLAAVTIQLLGSW
jgi:hypothetical protein